jgi:predicted PurR-regulated permease PerM
MHQAEKQFNRYFALFIIVVLGFVMYIALKDYLGMFFGTIIIFTLFRPLQKYLVQKKNWNRSLASFSTMFASVFALVIPVVLTVVIIGNAVANLVGGYSETIKGFIVNVPNLLESDQGILKQKLFNSFTLHDAISNININYGAIISGVTAFIQRLLTDFTSGLSNFLLQAIVMYFILFFLFRDWDMFAKYFYRYSPFNTKNTARLIKEFDNMTLSNVLGSGAVAISQGVAVWAGLSLFGLSENALFWGFITVITGFIPIIGAPLVWVPAVVILAVQNQWFNAIGLLVWSVTVVSWIDNFVRPYITAKVGNIHPLISIIGIFIGIPMFGFLGIILGPALLSFFLMTVEMFYEEFLTDKYPIEPLTQKSRRT